MFSLLIYSTFSTVSTRFSSFPACKPWKAELYYNAVEFRNLFQHHENTVSAPFLLSPPHICGGGTGDFTQPQPDGSNLSDRREIAPGRTTRDTIEEFASVAGIPSVGKFLSPSPERIAALAPTLVVSTPQPGRGTAQLLASLKIRFVELPDRTLEDYPALLRRLGRLLNLPAGEREALLAEKRLALSAATPRPFRRMKKFPSCFSPGSIRRSWPGGGVSSIR